MHIQIFDERIIQFTLKIKFSINLAISKKDLKLIFTVQVCTAHTFDKIQTRSKRVEYFWAVHSLGYLAVRARMWTVTEKRLEIKVTMNKEKMAHSVCAPIHFFFPLLSYAHLIYICCLYFVFFVRCVIVQF